MPHTIAQGAEAEGVGEGVSWMAVCGSCVATEGKERPSVSRESFWTRPSLGRHGSSSRLGQTLCEGIDGSACDIINHHQPVVCC